jgi:cobalamin biosynthesis Co2+ chelatase CbiK
VGTPEQVMQKLTGDGYTSLAIIVFDVAPGIEYDYDKRVFDLWETQRFF